ncbi:MAG TPA: hypothetical protein VFR24_08960 [Candidatus Angelobacter sp.]|nr:hypothetical protein [Candidatus Angelobacter sp.]
MMFAVRLLLCLSLLGVVAQAQHQANSYSIGVKQTGSDVVGKLLRQAMEEKLKQKNGANGKVKAGTSDEIELVTLDDPSYPGEASFVSIVVSTMIPGTWDVPNQWYHKVLLVKKSDVDAVASLFLDDLSASWCNVLKSSLSPCPAEAPWIGVPQSVPERPVAKPQRSKALPQAYLKGPL